MLRQVCQPAGAVFIAAHNVLSESFLHLPLRPIFRQLHPNFINVRLRNLGTIDKKSSRKIKYKKIPRVH